MWLIGILAIWVVNAQDANKDIILEAISTADNQTLKINKYFANAYTVDRWDGTMWNLTWDIVHTYSVASGYTIILSLSWTDRWTFQGKSKPLVPIAETTMSWVKIVSMPSLAEWFGDNAKNPGNNFFRAFNYQWALTSLPIWSFDTSSIEMPWNGFFQDFNNEWKLKALPDWSFNISNIETVGVCFFQRFNNSWALIELPDDSFNTSNIRSVGDGFFNAFNRKWSLIKLPGWSFNISNITWDAGDFFFCAFNREWELTSLPNDSFDISNIKVVWDYFFDAFNYGWNLTSLPIWSFDTSKITTVGIDFFGHFNREWALTSLPQNSFKIDDIVTVETGFFSYFNNEWALKSLPQNSFSLSWFTTVGDSFFYFFNLGWLLESLPAWSFNISNITDVWDSFFQWFNCEWALTRLPDDSFKTSNIKTVGESFFRSFNDYWALTSLPEGSFDLSWITVAGANFFRFFNGDWEITTLPDSFTMSSAWASASYWYRNSFNSPNYTLNKKVSDLVLWVTVPSSDRDTFSDNQLWKCGVSNNWLLNPAWTCDLIVIFDANGWDEILSETVSSWDKILLPRTIKTWYILEWWYDEINGWNKIWNIGDMLVINWNQTLYAKRTPNQYTITFDTDWWNEVASITTDYWAWITPPSNPTRNGYKFIGWNPEIPSTMPAENLFVKAKWEKLWSSGWGGRSKTSNDSEISPDPSLSRGEEDSSLIKEGDREAVEDLDSTTPMDSSDKSSEWQTYTQEFQEAYEFAKEKWITTMPTINDANMNWKLTRIAMAKMLSYYAINVLWMKPDETRINKFNDITDKLDAQYDSGVTLAYQLWIMWINMPNNKFRPYDEVTRAEFATALSRMLYKTSDGQYESTPEYYINHMNKLKEEWIITKDNPMMKELRGYVMIMLMRSTK